MVGDFCLRNLRVCFGLPKLKSKTGDGYRVDKDLVIMFDFSQLSGPPFLDPCSQS